MARTIRHLALAAVTAAAILVVPASASAQYENLLAPESTCPGQTDITLAPATQARIMLCMHRYARSQSGVKPLHVVKKLRASSSKKAHDIQRCDQFSHTACGRDAFYWFDRVGFFRGTWGAGENLALGSGDAGSPRAMMDAWLNSDEHRTVLLSKEFDNVGISMVEGGFQGWDDVQIWVAHFGYRD